VTGGITASSAWNFGLQSTDIKRNQTVADAAKSHRCDGQVWEHNWQDDYYGTKCLDCGLFFAYGCAPWDESYDESDSDRDDEDFDDEPDEFEEALGNCHAFLDGGVYVCMAAGSEDCDECPFNNELGMAPTECADGD
jgi:hypothetical protein